MLMMPSTRFSSGINLSQPRTAEEVLAAAEQGSASAEYLRSQENEKMISRDTSLVIIGAGIALVSSIVTAFVQHLLFLRADKLKRKWDQNRRESEALRISLTQAEPTLVAIREKIIKKGFDVLPSLHESAVTVQDEYLLTHFRKIGERLNLDEAGIEKLIDEFQDWCAEQEGFFVRC